jgi:Tfp pilus assembly protein PilN
VRAVNLIPRDESRARLSAGRVPVFAAAGGVVLVTAVAFMLATSASSSASQAKTDLEAVEAQLAALPRSTGSAVSQGMLMQERSDRVAALSAALGSRTAFDRLLREISYVLPANAWLTQLEASAPASSDLPPGTVPPAAQAPADASGVTIQGATFKHESIATVLARLSAVPSLSDVRLTGTTLVDPTVETTAGDGTKVRKKGKPYVTFVISASVNTGATP